MVLLGREGLVRFYWVYVFVSEQALAGRTGRLECNFLGPLSSTRLQPSGRLRGLRAGKVRAGAAVRVSVASDRKVRWTLRAHHAARRSSSSHPSSPGGAEPKLGTRRVGAPDALRRLRPAGPQRPPTHVPIHVPVQRHDRFTTAGTDPRRAGSGRPGHGRVGSSRATEDLVARGGAGAPVEDRAGTRPSLLAGFTGTPAVPLAPVPLGVHGTPGPKPAFETLPRPKAPPESWYTESSGSETLAARTAIPLHPGPPRKPRNS